MKVVAAVILLIALTGCFSWRKSPPPPASGTTPVKVVDVASRKADEATAAAMTKQAARLSMVKSNVLTARIANRANEDGHPKTIVDGELGLAEARMSDVAEDQAEMVAAANRKALIEAGRAQEARSAFEAEQTKAQQLVAAVATAERDRDAARAAEATARKSLEAQIEASRRANQKVLDDLQAAHKAEMDAERQAFFRWMGKALVGAGVLMILVGAFIAYASAQGGNVMAAITKGGVLAGAAAVCFACAWTINQPWFKWILIGGGTLSILGVAGYLWSEWQDGKSKRQRSVEADEAEDTLKKISAVIHELPKDDPLFPKLSKAMDSRNKALVLELMAESKRDASTRKTAH